MYPSKVTDHQNSHAIKNRLATWILVMKENHLEYNEEHYVCMNAKGVKVQLI